MTSGLAVIKNRDDGIPTVLFFELHFPVLRVDVALSVSKFTGYGIEHIRLSLVRSVFSRDLVLGLLLIRYMTNIFIYDLFSYL